MSEIDAELAIAATVQTAKESGLSVIEKFLNAEGTTDTIPMITI